MRDREGDVDGRCGASVNSHCDQRRITGGAPATLERGSLAGARFVRSALAVLVAMLNEPAISVSSVRPLLLPSLVNASRP